MSFDFHAPHYFSKSVRKEISELSVSTAFADLATAMAMIFEPIFLFQVLGFTVPQVLLFMATVYAFYIFLIPFGGKIASLYGYRHAIVISIPFQVLYWILVISSRNYIMLIWWAPLALAIEKSLFWPGFHAIVSRYGSAEQKGREFSLIYAIVNITQMLGPFLAGYLAQKFGITVSFAVASVIYCASAIPLLIEKEIFVPKLYKFHDTWELYKIHPKKFLGYVGFGEELLALTIWPIFIFVVLKSYEFTGIVSSAASVVAAVVILFIGKITDSYTKRILVKIGSFFTAVVWALRFVAGSFWGIFAFDTLARTSKDVAFVPISTLTYLRAEASHILPYVIFFEQSLSVGKLSASILGIVVFGVLGGGMAGFTGLFILAALYSLLYMFV